MFLICYIGIDLIVQVEKNFMGVQGGKNNFEQDIWEIV